MTEEKRETIRVLVVNDNFPLRLAIAEILEFKLGYTVHRAANGEEAVDILAQHDIDVAVINWKMPKMNGLELLAYMREAPTYAEIPVLLQSAEEMTEDAARAHGAQGFLLSPFNPAELVQAVQDILKESEVTEENP